MADAAAARAVSEARALLMLRFGFLGRLCARLRPEEDPETRTLATDGFRIFYNPEFFTGLPPPQRLTALAHEVMHPLYRHLTRRGGRDPWLWNIAGDLRINADLLAQGFAAIPGWLHLPRLSGDGGSTEDIYDRLEGMPAAELAGLVGDAPLSGDVRAPSDPIRQEAEFAAAVREAARLAAPESARGALSELVRGFLGPRADWRLELRDFVSRCAGSEDYSWLPPDEAFLQGGIVLPSLSAGAGLGEFVVALDTSLSMNARRLSQAGGELDAVLAGAEFDALHLVHVDVGVAAAEVLTKAELPLRLVARGRGGTDFRPAFAWVRDEGISPSCLIYLTDMECALYPEPPPYPVLWCDVSGRRKSAAPPFGRSVAVE